MEFYLSFEHNIFTFYFDFQIVLGDSSTAFCQDLIPCS